MDNPCFELLISKTKESRLQNSINREQVIFQSRDIQDVRTDNDILRKTVRFAKVAKGNDDRFLGNRIGNYFKRDDPYFEAAANEPGVANVLIYSYQQVKKGKLRKKAIPAGLCERDIKILKKVRSRAYHLGISPFRKAYVDRSLTCCCCSYRFGWAAVIGIIPFVGDAINLLMALSLIRTCMEAELPKHIVYRFCIRTITNRLLKCIQIWLSISE